MYRLAKEISLYRDASLVADLFLFCVLIFLFTFLQLHSIDPRIIPFGVGKRKCLGEVIARTSLYKFFTAIIQKYKVVSGQDQPIFENRSLGFVTAPKPYKLKFVKI